MVSRVGFAIEMQHSEDPAELIQREIGELVKNIRITGKDVLCCSYNRTKGETKTAGGIILPDSKNGVGDEDNIQGISHLIMVLGPQTKDIIEGGRFGEEGLKPGMWAIVNSRYGTSFLLKDFHLRIIEIEYVMGIIPRPDMVI
jgi:co-chaperonin GroES (HSP10)